MNDTLVSLMLRYPRVFARFQARRPPMATAINPNPNRSIDDGSGAAMNWFICSTPDNAEPFAGNGHRGTPPRALLKLPACASV